ncbi:hypothetical protein ACIRVK_04625 [Streptomyces sp. NPDC101152]|uniref:hypothetical protein n=1 Tax=Streptomyces sp. NPDC101152 TaxID=3366116 RepID=UPI0038213409
MPSSKRKKVAGGVGALVAVMVVVGCTTSGGGGDVAHRTSVVVTPVAGGESKRPLAVATAAPGPAQKLAAIDGGGRPAEEYQQVLDALARCMEGRSRLVDVVDATLRDLRRHGVGDVDAFGVLQRLEQAVPAGKGRVECVSAASAYAKVREAG